ncbi:uncharacterized protein [Malus domestica]|uniref:uncharacterized protein n=1 Tax=Malus domestica TaxID=3750 RepID=UPI003975FF15
MERQSTHGGERRRIPTKSAETDTEMVHLRIHRHPLTFKEEEENDRPPQFCKGCLEPVLGPHYACDTCNFNIHKPCAELPLEIHHPIHPKHPLILGENYSRTCGVCNCNQRHRIGYILSYYCYKCNFCIDLKCASKWQNDGHEHSFTNIRKPIEFTCDVCRCFLYERRTLRCGAHVHTLQFSTKLVSCSGCGARDKNFCFRCSRKGCDFELCIPCIKLPLTVRFKYDDHPLKLNYASVKNEIDEYFCDICEGKRDSKHWFYSCPDCDFECHPYCIRGSACVLHINRNEVARQDDQDEGITCNGCTLPIIRGESYRSCTEQEIDKPCNFSLHINCAKLPQKMLIPLHEHELTLRPTAPICDVFKCDVCESLSQGFSYRCEHCNFDLDLYCSFLYERRTLLGGAHVHTLQFSTKFVSCSGCGALDKNFCFRCSRKRCYFELCIPCIKLPLTVRYKYDDHPLKLNYDSVKNELNEYYCDICEGKRDPKHWFYSCPDCDFECHPHCIRGRYPQVKLGGSFKRSDHQHNVALVYKRKSEIPNDKRERLLACSKCSGICEGLVCECLECGINLHLAHDRWGYPVSIFTERTTGGAIRFTSEMFSH